MNKPEKKSPPAGFSPVEQAFLYGAGKQDTRIPYIVVDNFPKLGLITSLRFLEWASENPEGIISLPTGKTPEYFIKWCKYILDNWDRTEVREMLEKYNFPVAGRPELSGLRFVQIDEFYPISSARHNSFTKYVRNFYLENFGMDPGRAMLIDCDRIPLAGGRSHMEVFPDSVVDLTLRNREAGSSREKLLQESIRMIDQYCDVYEQRIREMGGIGFFLGGIGPDGHIAFNTRGTSHYSTTRLTELNFETQAVAATDLGGIEISKNRLAITIGLDTITYNKNAVAIVIAAGEAKAGIVKDSLENETSVTYPASVLNRLDNSRFYLTRGAAARLTDTITSYYDPKDWSFEKSERSIIDLCVKIDKFGSKLTIDDLRSDPFVKLIPDLGIETVAEVQKSIEAKFRKGLEKEEKQVFLHTGPHHDDIMLGMLPHVAQQMRVASNELHFAVLTSGFTAVTNRFLENMLAGTKELLHSGQIGMVNYPDFFQKGYLFKWDKDVYHYLDKVARQDRDGMIRGIAHRVVRAMVEIYGIKDIPELKEQLDATLNRLSNLYDGEKNPEEVQKLKGMLREFEEELVWSHFGVQVKNIHHLRLGFYTGDIFTKQPEKSRDVMPVLEMLRKIRPTVVSLALDPEGSGPDTHYKVLQTIAEALRMWEKEEDLSRLRIWGYRNVWYRFHPSEVNVISPISLNGLSNLNETFRQCYLSQVDASFPSYELDGWFSRLAQRIWVEQMDDMQHLLGKDFFYQNDHPKIRGTHGVLYFKEMELAEFLGHARELEKSMEGILL